MNREYLRRLLEDSRVIELRHQHESRWISGTFDSLYALENAIRSCSDRGNLYTSLNRPGVQAANRMGTQPLTNDDITTITRIVFDLDPIRPTGVASTDAELSAALEARRQVVALLTASGWPTPALGISGNGGHIVYRTCIRSTAGWRQGSAVLYAGIRSRLRPQLDELGVSFDVAVRNPGRIWRLYGVENRKGEATAERPHRLAAITLPAGAWQVVRAATIKRTIDALKPTVVREQQQDVRRAPVRGAGDYRTLDVVAWFRAHGAYVHPAGGGSTHTVICPWSREHSTPRTDGDCVIFEADAGWPGWFCHHSHCEGRSIRDVIALWGDADAFCARAWEGRSNG
jgi:hypothetical protein